MSKFEQFQWLVFRSGHSLPQQRRKCLQGSVIASSHLSPPLPRLPWKLACPHDTGGTPDPLPLPLLLAASGRSGGALLERDWREEQLQHCSETSRLVLFPQCRGTEASLFMSRLQQQ